MVSISTTCDVSEGAEENLVPLVLETWNTLMPYMARLAELYDALSA